MRDMFRDASAFNHDISSWTGSAATSAQTDMFLDASAFQAKFTCDRRHHRSGEFVRRSLANSRRELAYFRRGLFG